MKRKRILIVEDHREISDLIRFNLEQAGFETEVLGEGRHLPAKARRFRPHLIMLDLMLPDIDGLDLCRLLKRDSNLASIPILIVTAKGAEADRIVGLELGADDYIVKPFSPRELVLRVKAILGRVYPEKQAGKSRSISLGPIVLDPVGHTVTIRDKPIDLTATEFRLLQDLMSNAGSVRTRRNLLENVWGYTFDGYARTVDTHIRRLRKKLGVGADRIKTVRGIGYRFEET